MTQLPTRLRARLTYANVTASLALFIALGGTSYAALKLPRNSVGSAQIRNNAVGPSEIRPRAVRSSEIRDDAIVLNDISEAARAALRGATGPEGPTGPRGAGAMTFRAGINSAGGASVGNARNSGHALPNEYTVEFPADVNGLDLRQCIYNATLAAVQNGPTLEQPPAGRITVANAGPNTVLVKTYGADGGAAEAPFHLTVAC